ncbi:MAG: TIGR03086 family metal-binding protein [Actinomycetota bacterium]|nr:TIGR03086 family metal-binding protein [Actinomycetota bacterium]
MDNDAHAQAMKMSSDLAATVIAGTAPDQHDAPTPCTEYSVADVINHLAFGFEMARRSGVRESWDLQWQPDSTAPALDGVAPADWAAVCGREAPRTAQAWADPGAWEGESTMGSSAMPAAMVGSMMTAEFLVHGWDLATATGQPYDPPDDVVQAAIAGVQPMLEMGRDGGWYGAEVTVAESAPALHRLLAMTGRDPVWTPATKG